MTLETLRPDGWLVWTPVPFGLGVGLCFSLPEEPPLQPLLTVIALATVALLLTYRWPAVRFCLAALLLLSSGGLSAKLSADLKGGPLLERRLPPRMAEGRVELQVAASQIFRLVHGGLTRACPSPAWFARISVRILPSSRSSMARR